MQNIFIRQHTIPTIYDIVKEKLQINLPRYTNLFCKDKIKVESAALTQEVLMDKDGNPVLDNNGNSIILDYIQLSLQENIATYIANSNYVLENEWNIIKRENQKDTSRIFIRNLFAGIECESIEVVEIQNNLNRTLFHNNLLKVTLKENTYIYYCKNGLNFINLANFYGTFYNSDGSIKCIKDFSGGYYVADQSVIPEKLIPTNINEKQKTIFLHIPKNIVNASDLFSIYSLQNYKPKQAEILTTNTILNKDNTPITFKTQLVYEIFRIDNVQKDYNSKGTFGGYKNIKDIYVSKDGKTIKYLVGKYDAKATPIVISQFDLQTEVAINDHINISPKEISDFFLEAEAEQKTEFEANNVFNNNYHQIFIIPAENTRMPTVYDDDYAKKRQGGLMVLISLDLDKIQKEILYIQNNKDRYANNTLAAEIALREINTHIVNAIDMCLNGYSVAVNESFFPISTVLSNELHSPLPSPKNAKKFLYQINFVYNYITYSVANDMTNPEPPVNSVVGFIDNNKFVSTQK